MKFLTYRLVRASLTLAMLCLASASVTRADTTTFTFEGQSTTSGSGALTSLTLTQSGLTATITRPGSGFDINNIGGSVDTAAFGARSLDPFSASTSNTQFIANFSQSLSSVSLDFGDFGGDADTLLLQAFSGANGTGTLLGSANASLVGVGSTFTFLTLSVTAPGINSIRFIGGSATFPNSVYYDNLSATFGTQPNPVPEPTTLLLLGTGIAGVAAKLRQRRNTQEDKP